jgi:hypothetical protein
MPINISDLNNVYHFCKVVVEEHAEARHHAAHGRNLPIYAYNNGVLLYNDCVKLVDEFEKHAQHIEEMEKLLNFNPLTHE